MALTFESLKAEIASCLRIKEFEGVIAPDTGVAVTVVQDGRVRFESAFGLRDREKHLPVDNRTLFSISSSTKAFTSLAFLMAAEKYAVDLDEVIKYGPLKGFSISDILCHRTNLPSHDLLWILSGLNANELWSRVSHFSAIPTAKPNSFSYGNVLYSALQEVFLRATGDELEHFVNEAILKKTELKATTFDAAHVKKSANAAQPYAAATKMLWADVSNITPAGGLFSNIEDVSKWLIYLTSNEQKAHFEIMAQEHTAIENLSPLIMRGLEWLADKPAYGFGWFVSRALGKKVLFHPGIIDGFSSVMIVVPELRLSIAVLTNANLSPLPGIVARQVLSSVFGESIPVPEMTASAPQGLSAPPMEVHPELTPFLGLYKDPAYGTLKIVRERDRAILRYGTNSWPLSFSGPTEGTFLVTAFGLQIPLPATFEMSSGRVNSVSIPFSMDPRLKPQVFQRID